MRYSIKTSAGALLGMSETAQTAGDIAGDYVNARQGLDWAFSIDSLPGTAFPVYQYREEWRGHIVGTPFRSIEEMRGS